MTSNKDEALFNYLIDLLWDIKLVGGPDFLKATLNRHDSIRKFLINYLKDKLEYLEVEVNKR